MLPDKKHNGLMKKHNGLVKKHNGLASTDMLIKKRGFGVGAVALKTNSLLQKFNSSKNVFVEMLLIFGLIAA